jgi:hypothetical protein
MREVVGILHNLTDMRRKASACLGLCVAIVPESYQHILELMDKVVNEWEEIPILPGDHIQSSVVLDEAELPIFLLDEEDWGSKR